jgi:hypothetical protein
MADDTVMAEQLEAVGNSMQPAESTVRQTNSSALRQRQYLRPRLSLRLRLLLRQRHSLHWQARPNI